MTTNDRGRRDRVLDFGGFPGRWEITKLTEETDGERFETRWDLEAVQGDGPFTHTHPNATERFEVLSGVLEVKVEGEWLEVPAGEEHTVPPGTAHTFRNKTPVEVINVHEPALAYEDFFRRFHGLVTERGVSLPPDGFSDVVLLAMLTTEYEEEFHAVSPPHWTFRALTFLGRGLGYRLPDSPAPLRARTSSSNTVRDRQ